MAKKPKKNKGRKGSQPAKKQTAAQQKRAERALAKKLEKQGADQQLIKELGSKGADKNTATKAAKFARMGYSAKAAIAAAKNSEGSVNKKHAATVEGIKSKLMNSKDTGANELREMIEEDFPGARFRIDALAELIAQGRYEEYVDEYRNDFATYKKAYFRKAEEAQEIGSPDADRLMERAFLFSSRLDQYTKTRRQYKKRG